jgi:hypothetical protein
LELDDHDDRSHSCDHNHKGPQEIHNAYPDVRSVGESEHANDCGCSYPQANTSVYLPLREREVDILTSHKQEDTTADTVRSDHYTPGNSTTPKRQHQQAIVTPHIVK